MRIFAIYIFLMNIVAFLMYGLDKQKARMNRWRIPEKVLLLLAVLGGSVGAYVSMKMFRHKTQKPKFYLGVPLIFLLQIGAVIAIEYYL